MTGCRGSGKTTLVESLPGSAHLPGVRSFLQRDSAGQPRQVVLEARQGPGRCIIGRWDGQRMAPVPHALEGDGVAMLEAARHHDSPWVLVDEIGFLEQAGPGYRQALRVLFDQKRVVAVLRRADLPFLVELKERGDCLLLDLDHVERWA